MSLEQEDEIEEVDELENEDGEPQQDGDPRGFDEGEEGEGAEDDGPLGDGGLYNAREVNDQVFEELVLSEDVANEVSLAWSSFIQSAESSVTAGDAVYAAIFDAAPGLQSLFKTPRAVMGLRFVKGLGALTGGLLNPKGLKVQVETLAFQHMDIEVTVPRVAVFRDAIVDALHEELGARFSPKASDGWATLLNYAGGAFIHVRVKYADRLKVLAASWAQANNRSVGKAQREAGAVGQGSMANEEVLVPQADAGPINSGEQGHAKKTQKKGQEAKKDGWTSLRVVKKKTVSSRRGSSDGREGGSGEADVHSELKNTGVPRTFRDMFLFNVAVMGYNASGWMQEILASFDTIVTNISNSYRLQEECDLLSLRIAKYKGVINLADYKAVMLSSLRSLVKEWGSMHETSWSWLWENVERMLKAHLGKPAAQESVLARVLGSIDPNTFSMIRRDIYKQFFTMAPAGQDHFKQSTTRLHFIADRVFAFSLDMYREPKRMVDDLSALGLRHVGYGIPTEMFAPFVTCCVHVFGDVAKDETATDAFSWSLSLISRMLQRVIAEGSTVVMQAINANSAKQLRSAVACAARGDRASWMLKVQVGTQSISPLMWAIESGSFEAATAIISDLLTIRADRDRYYYGMDALFQRHPDIINRLCLEAPELLPVLLDGLVWRSRITDNGKRRVNYYIKHLVLDSEGDFARAIEWIVDYDDPKLAIHPIVALVSDMVWNQVALRTFLFRRAWFLLNLIVFLLAQSILHYIDCSGQSEDGAEEVSSIGVVAGNSSTLVVEATPSCVHGFWIRLLIILFRGFIYTFSMVQMVFSHAKRTCRSIADRDFMTVGRIKLPSYWSRWQDSVSLCLMLCLMIMIVLDPTVRCARWSSDLFDDHCPEGEAMFPYYKPFSTCAALLYFWLLSDLAVLSTRISSFVLVCCKVASEVLLTLTALSFFVLAFASAMSSLNHKDPSFAGIQNSALTLYRISFGMLAGSHFDDTLEWPSLFGAIVVFNLISVIFLSNLLIAQLNCAYQVIYNDMVGFARLNRGKVVVETMPSVPRQRFEDFVTSLRLNERIEFGEGDVGLAGGVQVLELASLNMTTVDVIRRFGGTTSPEAQWPAEDKGMADETDGFDRLEKHITKAVKRMTGKSKRGGGQGDFGSSVLGSSMVSGESASTDKSSEE